MNRELLSVLLAVLLLIIGFSGCFEEKQTYVVVKELIYEPEEYNILSEVQLNNIPSLEKAIQNPGEYIETTSEENDNLIDLFPKMVYNFRYQEKFYEIEVLAQT